jgi:hypothetical protein
MSVPFTGSDRGTWLPWLRDNADVLGFENPSTAGRLIKAAQNATIGKSCAGAQFHDPKEALQISREIWGHTNLRGTLGTGETEWFTPPVYIGVV